MSRIKNMMLNYKSMRDYAHDIADMVTYDMYKYGFTDISKIKKAILSRYQLDELLLDQESMIEKWAQYSVFDNYLDFIRFRGSKEECESYIDVYDQGDLEILEVLPSHYDFNWNLYLANIKERSHIKVM